MTKTLFALAMAFNLGFTAPALAIKLPIVGGDLVTEQDAFANRTVALFFFTENSDGKKSQGLCTGSIMDSGRILTAAHCIENFKSGFVVFSLNGVIDYVKGAVQNDADAMKVTRKITSVKAEPGYEPGGGDGEFNDLAVVKFAGGLPAGYVPAKFLTKKATLDAVQAGGAIILSGYGITRPSSQQGVGTLRKVDRFFMKLTPKKLNLWVSGSFGHDACSGDSGGPAMVQQGGEYYVVGVASRSDCVQSSIYTIVGSNTLPKR